ncbi:MAG: ion channel [Candidatus Woesearchaeota archaeon]
MSSRAYTAARPHRVAGQFRYGAVLFLILTLVFFQIAAPSGRWAFAIDIALAGAALTVAVATSRARGSVRRRRAQAVAIVGVIVFLGIAIGVVSATATFVVLTLIVAALPVTLAGGLVRLIKEEGVTVQVVAGALAMYLLVGLLFASIIAFVSHVERGPFFQQGSETDAVDLYYSFTVLTTTGFGDYTSRTSFGHALAVLEMLIGQLYLVTVIGIAVGSLVGRRAKAGED